MKFNTKTATIANGAKTSGAIGINRCQFVRIKTPAAVLGPTLTFLATEDSVVGTYVGVYGPGGAAVSLTVAKGGWQPVPTTCIGHHALKIVMSSAQTTSQTVTVCVQE